MVKAYSKEEIVAIGARLKEARLKRGLSQWQLCRKVGLKDVHILSGYEIGRFPIKEKLVQKFAKELGVTTNYILEGEKEMAMSSVTVKKEEVKVPEVIAEPVAKEVITEPVKKHPHAYVGKRKDYVWMKGDVFEENYIKSKLRPVELAELLNMNKQTATATYKKWFKGENRIYISYINILAEYFGISPDDLIDKERNEREPIICNGGPGRGRTWTDKKDPSPTTPIVVTMEAPKDIPQAEEKKPIPINAEQAFVQNVKYYISKNNLDEGDFLEKIGAEDGFFDLVIKHNVKIPLAVVLKIARELDMSVEDLVFDDSARKITEEILAMEKRMAELKAMIGMK